MVRLRHDLGQPLVRMLVAQSCMAVLICGLVLERANVSMLKVANPGRMLGMHPSHQPSLGFVNLRNNFVQKSGLGKS